MYDFLDVACALFKESQFIEDTKGIKTALHYLRTKDGKEIDFLISIEGAATLLLEVKLSDATPARNFDHFAKFLSKTKKIQVVKELVRDKTYSNGLEIRSLIHWLMNLVLEK